MSSNQTTDQPNLNTGGRIINNNIVHLIKYINYGIIGQTLALCGLGANAINIVVFYKMGFKESINVNLFSLAISDFLSCFTCFFVNLGHTYTFEELDLPFNALHVQYIAASVPHVAFAKISSCVTSFIAFERCICVTFPLKVKGLITSKRVKIFLVCTWVIFLGLYAPSFYINRLTWVHDPSRNKTILALKFSDDRAEIIEWLYPIRGILPFWFFFIFTSICTTVLVMTLKRNAEWRRRSATSGSKSGQSSLRETKVATLVTLVCIVFITCYVPSAATPIAMTIMPDINLGKKYQNLLTLLYSFNFMFESISAFFNIFIYYLRSSNYKATFDFTFCCRKKEVKEVTTGTEMS